MSQNQYAVALGMRLQKIRKEAKLSQSDIAAPCEVTAAMVSHWECGRHIPNAFQLQTISKLTGADLNSLITGRAKILLDATDMWPGNQKLIAIAMQILHTNEIARDKAFSDWWERHKNWDKAEPPTPPWYDPLPLDIKIGG